MPQKRNRGQLTLELLVLGAVAVILVSGFGLWAASALKLSLRGYSRSLAFSIAEAGIEYYRWHLAHNPTDYTDGTGQPGPYTHNYYDKDGQLLGRFILNITPPPTGSTIVKIKSTGQPAADSSIEKVIQVKMGIPSFAKYAIAANDRIRFGVGTTFYGQIHSNDGIRFDGFANNIISSAKADYDDPDHTGGNEFGVHTHRDQPPAQGSTNDSFRPQEAPPPPAPSRPDVFGAGRQFPVPAVDFTGLTADLAQIKAAAQSNGLYFAPSSALGYELVLKTDDTFDLYKVTATMAPPNNCVNALNESGWGTWSIRATTTVGNYPIPANGLIFLEDHVWVGGKINSARVTIAAGRFPENPSTDKSITVNSDLLYTNYDGQDVISLVAQNNVNAGLLSEDDLRIDGAIVAKNGRVGRYYYRKPSGGQAQYCGPTALRSIITLYGMIVTNKRYGFSWVCGGQYCSGYDTRNIIYDANLLYGPPPSFPLASDQYVQLSWEEVK